MRNFHTMVRSHRTLNDGPKVKSRATAHPATAATIMRNFHTMDPKSRNNAPGNGRNDYAEFPPLLAKSRDNTTTHNKPATAATIMQNFHPCWQSRAQPKVTRQHNNTQQTGNGRNDYVEFLLAKSRDNTTTHNKPAAAMAATIMRNFHTVSTQKIPAGQNGLNTSFSKENSEYGM